MHWISFRTGGIKILPFAVSGLIFGMIFGFVGASAGFPLRFISAMSYIIFAGSAQFITLILLIENEHAFGIMLAAVLVNIRHLIYGAALHNKIKWKGLKKLPLAYLLTDEAFLISTLTTKEDQELEFEWVLFGAGLMLWVVWNLATIGGYLIEEKLGSLISFPENFVIVASFLGFLIDHWRRYPEERLLILILSFSAVPLGFMLSPTWVLVALMVLGAIISGARERGRLQA